MNRWNVSEDFNGIKGSRRQNGEKPSKKRLTQCQKTSANSIP